MGQVFGIFARSKGQLLIQTPLTAEKESLYSLATIFKDANGYVNRILTESRMEQARKDWLLLSAEEERSLKYNNIQDFADDEIAYKQSVNEDLEKDFYAIGMAYDADTKAIVYAAHYEPLENWSTIDVVSQALYKIKEVLFEDLKMTIESGEDSDYIKYSYDNIQLLLGMVSALKNIKDADEIAITYGPY
jgi:hypothetical protein